MCRIDKSEKNDKVIVDIVNNDDYYDGMRMLSHTPYWFVNNIAQPRKNDKEEKT
jgi:hypothetical protein